jgi:hypothetical protein
VPAALFIRDGVLAPQEVEVRAWVVALFAFTAMWTVACQRIEVLRVLWMQGDLGIAYVGEGSVVERASADQDTRVIATARRLRGRITNDPAVTEIEIEETHFVKGTLDVVYRGRVTFRCKADESFCDPMSLTPEFGVRPRDVFWRWPATMNARPFSP